MATTTTDIDQLGQDQAKSNQIQFGNHQFDVARPHPFGIVIEGSGDYLHEVLLSQAHKESFLKVIEREGLVVCKSVDTKDPTYRRVRGKSSGGKLSQAEYFHHDGCSCPVKPRVVEIRLPHQPIQRDVATAIAPFGNVMEAMLKCLPEHLKSESDIAEAAEQFSGDLSVRPPTVRWDKIQGRVTRLVRREMDAESCRSFFRDVDAAAGAYVVPWEMGESRLMLNNHEDLSQTMQHRRSYQKIREQNEQNGSLVKRWTAEEYPGEVNGDQTCVVDLSKKPN